MTQTDEFFRLLDMIMPVGHGHRESAIKGFCKCLEDQLDAMKVIMDTNHDEARKVLGPIV